MKFILIIFSTIMINACGGSKDLASNTADPSNKMTQERFEQEIPIQMLEYTANTRGFHILIRVTEQFINYRHDRNEELIAIPNTEEHWSELMALMAKIDIESLPSLEAPSKAHRYDGAAHASLSVYKQKEDSKLQTPTFDAGNPNKVIAPVVEKMLSLIPPKN